MPLERTLQLPGSDQRQRPLLKLLLYFRVIRTQLLGLYPVVGRAGHWVQQEQPDRVVRLLLEFLRAAA